MSCTKRPIVALAPLLVALLGCGISEKLKEMGGEATAEPAGSASASAAAAASAAPAGSAADGTVAAPTTTKPPELAVGQWATYRVTDKAGKQSEARWAVVGEEEGALWLEVEMNSPKTIVMQMLLKIADRTKPDSVDIRKVKMKIPGRGVQTLSGSMLKMTNKSYSGFAKGLEVPRFETMEQEDITVPAGTFKQAYVHTDSTELMGLTAKSKLWNHPAVPITTMVKLESKDSSRQVWELKAYGMTGAKSKL